MMRLASRASALVRASLSGASLSAATLLGGCTLLFGTPSSQLTNRCDTVEDCAGSAVCDTSTHLCLSPTAPRYAVRVEVTPTSDPIGGEPVPMLFDLGVLPSPTEPMELVAPVQVPVQGTARLDGAPIAAQITFTRRPSPDETALVGALASSIAVRASASTSGPVDFVTQLPGGATYDVYVEPQSEFRAALPPISATLEVPEGTGISFAIAYAEDQLTEHHGVVLDADGQPQEGLLVRLVDGAGRALSSRASTDEEGHFTLWAPREVTSFSYRVRGDTTRQDSSALLPSITIRTDSLLPSPDGSVTLLVPRSDRALRLEGRVELPPTLGANAPAASAQVHLESPYVSDPETGLVGSLELDLTTDAEGRFVGYVLPGHYEVEIISADEDAGVLATSLEVLSNPSGLLLGQLYTLPSRSILGGTARLSNGEPIAGARIRASAVGTLLATDPTPAARLNRSATALSGAMGEFRLPLDVGVYDLSVELPVESGYAWHVEADFGVGGSSAPLRREMSVAAPHRVTGTARFSEGTALANARVRFFALHPESGRPIEIGAAECDETGTFVALLPHSL